MSLKVRSCRGKMDSTRSQLGEPGVTPSPPSVGMQVMYACTRRRRSAGDSGTVEASCSKGVVGSPEMKSECL
jgi:hypothetical protein